MDSPKTDITLLSSSASHHWNPFHTPPYPPSSNFTDQFDDSGSPLFINASVPNTLFTLPDDATHGLSSFAYTIGLRPQDLFSVCLILFLSILAGAVLLAVLVWFIDYLACSIANTLGGPGNSGPHTVARLAGARSPGFSSIKEIPDTTNSAAQDERKSLNGQSPTGHGLFKPPSRFALPLSTGGSSTERGINRISIGAGAGSWVAYGILIILALVFLALLLMLLVKLVEALVRIFGQVGFDRSRHVVDGGLLGACGLLGCCGSRQRHKKRLPRDRKNAYLHPQQQPRDSDVSSYIPPTFPSTGGEASPPRFLGAESRRGSSSLGPPSVLRPEHAMRPYREDSEDEGYIMGAWKPYPRTGYTPVLHDSPVGTTRSNLQQQLTKPSQTTIGTAAPSGFSRIGGGRAHIDAPYAIATGSTHTFPSIGNSTMHPHTLFDDDESPPPSLSNVEGRQTDFSILPPGAAQPSHIRTKSQTAIVENADILAALQGSGTSGRTQQHESSAGGLLRPPVMAGLPHDNDDEDSEEIVTKKKSWFRLGRSRVHSSEGLSAAGPSSVSPSLPVEEELGGGGSTSQTTRSFVVIRKAQPGSAGSRSANAGS
ncbi:hypothetical protein C0992_013046 [Termitomyces sp. T32_za158]|nr:hypothetical protein C0992_013046 [Termitomyces sp. T32_za158]